MPKRYADSIAVDLQRYDQLKRVVKSQGNEIYFANKVIDSQTEELNQLDSLNRDNVSYYEDYEIPRHKKKIKILGLVVTVEALLLFILIL